MGTAVDALARVKESTSNRVEVKSLCDGVPCTHDMLAAGIYSCFRACGTVSSGSHRVRVTSRLIRLERIVDPDDRSIDSSNVEGRPVTNPGVKVIGYARRAP